MLHRIWDSLRRPAAGFLILAIAVGYLLYQANTNGTEALRTAEIRQCNELKVDASLSAGGWRLAQVARLNTAIKNNDESDYTAARGYGMIADRFEQRALIQCDKAFPAP
jgi:hypothetical protein